MSRWGQTVGAPPLDTIELVGVRGYAHHGVLPAERRDGQEFTVDVWLGVDTREASRHDDLAATVDYGAVAADVHAVLTGPPCDLIETVAQRIADACLAYPRVRVVEVALHKPAAPIPVPFADVVVRIERWASR